MRRILAIAVLWIWMMLFSFLFFAHNSNAQVIFQDSFDSQIDWTLPQTATQDSSCVADCGVPTGWDSYYNGRSFCTNNPPGSNNIYLSSIPGFPILASGTCRGNSGKCLTFWDESCDPYWQGVMQDSDGQLGKTFDRDYPELYLRFYIKFEPNYQWGSTLFSYQHKFLHMQAYCGSGSHWERIDCNRPSVTPGLHVWGSTVYYYAAYRCENGYYCDGTPSYTFDVSGDMDHIPIGSWASTFGDGNWHRMEFYFKFNSDYGVKDGVHKFWLDGVLKYDSSTHNGGQGIPFADAGSIQQARGFKWFSLGGNNNNHWIDSCSGVSCEQWYSIDDVCISTTYIGDTYCSNTTSYPTLRGGIIGRIQ